MTGVQTCALPISLNAANNTDARANADASATQGKLGIGAAVALNAGSSETGAIVAAGAQVKGQGVSLEALMKTTASGDKLNSMGASALAGAGGRDIGVAGAAAINIETSTVEAVIGKGSSVNGGAGTVLLAAENDTANVVSARPHAGGATGGNAGIGASLALDIANNLTRAEVEDTGAVTTTGDLLLGAASAHSAQVSAEAGARSDGGFAAAPAVALAIENNDTHVRLGASTIATNIGGSVLGVAVHQSNVETDAGGTAAGRDAAIGASLALTLANDATQAQIDRDLAAGGSDRKSVV